MELERRYRMSYYFDITNVNAKRNHWLGNPTNTNITGEPNRSKLFDKNRLLWCIRNDEMQAFYKNSLWLKTRENILIRDHYECQRCKRLHRLTTRPQTLYVHHICELKKFPEHCLNEAILVTLCWECHETVHGRNKPLEIDTFTNFDSSEFIF